MSPSDKNEATNTDSKEDSHINQESVKSNGIDTFPIELSSSSSSSSSCSSSTSSSSSSCISSATEHGTITNIPSLTAKISTLKCSDNDQMKTFDPGETGNIDNANSKQCGYSLFPLKNSNTIAKSNKNYKAGSKINKLADMLAKRSQNIVEMTQNVTLDVVADIISAPKVENNSPVDISEIAKSGDCKVDVCSEKTQEPFNCINERQSKSVSNENSDTVKKLKTHSFSDISEEISQETCVSEFNALKEHLVKSETDGSTKNKEEVKKNLKNLELSLMLSEKKRSSPRTRLVCSEVNKQPLAGIEKHKSDKNIGSQLSASTNLQKRPDKSKSGKQRKSKRLVETSTQTSTTDFVYLDASRCEAEQGSSSELQPAAEFESEAGGSTVKQESTAEKLELPVQHFCEEEFTEIQLLEEKSDVTVPKKLPEFTEKLECETDPETEEKSDETYESERAYKFVYACMYCPASFVSRTDCKQHEKSHSPKKNKQNIKCQFCVRRFQSFSDLKSHCYKNHPNKYAYCVKCDDRFCEKSQLYEHNKLLHLTKAMETAQTLVIIQETLGINPKEKTKEEIEEIKKSIDKKSSKPTATKSDLKVDVSFDNGKKSMSPRMIVSPRETKTEEQLLEMEMLFYSHLSGNIKENLTNHLDGKIDKSVNPVQTDLGSDSSENSQAKIKNTTLLSVVTTDNNSTPEQMLRAPSPYQTRSKTPNPLPPTAKKFKKLPNWQQKFWEKYNFPTNYRYEHRFWDKNYLDTEKSAFYLKDLSCLDIKTQLIMRENMKKLDIIKNEESNKSDKLTFPEYLSLVPKVPDGNSQKNDGEVSDFDSTNKNQCNKDDKKPTRITMSDLSRSRRKTSAESPVSKRGAEKNTNRNSDGTKMMTRRQSVIELKKIEDTGKRRKGSLDVSDAPRMTLRRQTSLDNLQRVYSLENSTNNKVSNYISPESDVNENESEENLSSSLSGFAEISGEWVRPRSYLCGTCCAKFTNLWELEDHKWVSHPNVWCTHYEFEDEKIDKLFHRNEVENAADNPSEDDAAFSKLKLTDLYKRYLLPHGSLKTAKLVPNVSFPEQCTKCNKNCMSLPELHKHMLDCGGDTTWFLTMYSSPMSIKRRWRPFGSRRRKQIGRRVLKRNIPNTSNIRSYHYQHRIRTKPGDVESIQKMLANLPEKRARRAINFDKEIKTRSQATIRSNRILRKRFKVSFGTNMLRLKALKQQKQVKVKKEISSKSATDTSSENSPTGSPKRKNRQKDNSHLMKEENIIMESMSNFEEEDDKKKVLKQKSKKKETSPKKESTKKEQKKESSKKCKKTYVKSNSTVTGECAKEINSRDKKKKILPTGLESAPKKDTVEASSGDAKSKKNKSSKSPKKKPTQKDMSGGKQLKKDLIQIDLNASPKETPAEKKMKTDVEEEKIIEQISEVMKESKKGKKGESPGKNVLRLKSNDKEKTELIKRIRKTLKNSKKILGKKEIKDQDDRRRSLRIQTLQLTDSPRANEYISSLDKDLKELTDTEIKRPKSPLLTLEKDAFAKKTSKIVKSPKIDYFTVHHNEIAPPIRRSSRNSLGSLTDVKSEISDELAEKDASNIIKIPDSYQNISLEANQSELADTIKRSPVNESLRDAKTPESNSGLPVGFEFESIRKGGRLQNTKNDMESQVKPSQNIKDTPLNRELVEVNTENLHNDLEMPVLAKEDTSLIVRGRATRKSESEIPVLMPYVNSETVSRNNEEHKAGKRRGVVTFKVVNKKHKSTEKLNPLKIVKETSTVPQVENVSNSRSKKYVVEECNDGKLKKRKRFDTSEPANGECPLPKTPKVKKYFLGICPNEIDKGGDEKDESGSDSEPLITFLISQKEKINMPASRTVQEVEQPSVVEVRGAPPIKNMKREISAALVPKKKKPKSKKESRKKEKKAVPGSNEINKTFLSVTKIEQNREENEEIDSAEIGQEKLSLETSQTEMEKNGSDEFETKKHVRVKKSLKGLKMTVKLQENALKILDNTSKSSLEIKEQISEAQMENETKKMERRSRRVSKEVKSTNEFVIDDPLILVDELWSDLDSDSDGSRKRSKKNKKKSAKKKMHEEKRESSVNLEELLRNFGESKNYDTKLDSGPKKLCIKLKLDRKKRKILSNVDKRKQLEDRFLSEERSYKRLSLRLFKFHRKVENFGNLGLKLLKKEDIALGEQNTDMKPVPALPFLTAEIKENPVQIIQCGTQKPKPQKKSGRKSDFKLNQNMQLKISLPLQNINNLAVLNNNHLTEVGEVDLTKTQDIPDVSPIINKTLNNFSPIKIEDIVEPVGIVQKEEESDLKLKSRRSEIIDKIFYCEICKTYYYSSSQLKIHKLSNRHKQKECELLQPEKQPEIFCEVAPVEEMDVQTPEPAKTLEEGGKEELVENIDAEKINDDTSEMPILEGPFIENPFVRLGIDPVEPPQKPSPPSNMFGFTEDCLKDIQKAIGCTDEEMLILTLLGENSIEIENDILDLDSCQPVTPNAGDVKTQNVEEVREKENSNGLFKLDFKKRITSALARLVNKAVLNLLQKYKSTHRIGISPEALSFLIRLSKVNNKKNLLELDELLKNENEGESSNRTFANEEEKREHSVPYKYLCSICDARFQKESTMEWHVIRSHRSKGTRDVEDLSSEPATNQEEKEEETLPYKYLCTFCGARFQKESIKECHIIRAHRNRMMKNTDEPSSSPGFTKEDDKKEQNTPYKYLCTICGSRFQKESMWECHVKRSHKTKAKKNVEETQMAQTTYEEDWSSTWTYDINDELPGSVEAPQFLCSDCGINFTSPQEVLEHQKLEHSSPKDGETNESGPLQSSTIGSSDEIIKGKKAPRRGPKHLTKAELDQQMIIANNELKKLDRKFSSKSKSNRVKWGVDALKFTVEKENKALPEPEDSTESLKHQMDPKNLDVVPKINLSRTSSLPEFKVTQKATCLNRFQRILDNKMKRKSVKNDAKEAEEKEADKTFLEPEVIIKKERKRKQNKCSLKKDDERKVFDVYDFNDSESEPEPVAFSHVKRVGPPQSPTKLKLVKIKDATETEKNKADSTTKDLETEDYDSEDSLPLSVVKKSKAEEDEEEIRGEDQIDKSEGILEQVEYLIEQLENETNNPKSKEEESEKDTHKEGSPKVAKAAKKGKGGAKSDVEDEEEGSIDSQPETFRISLENKFLHLENLAMGKKNEEVDETVYELQESPLSNDKPTEISESKEEEILPVADSSQGMSDEEDSIPLVLMSKKNDDPDLTQKPIKNSSEIHRESSFVRLDEFGIEAGDEEDEEDEADKIPPETDADSPKIFTGNFASNGNEEQSGKIDKSFETVNGNVIYRRNDSMSGFDSDLSDYETISSNLDRKNTSPKGEENLIKEVMEKEDVVIVCSKKEQDVSKSGKKKPKEPGRKRKQITETVHRKKKILPLLSVTLEENKFRKSESPKLKKDVIMKKIWSRRRPLDDVADDISENSLNSRENDLFENSLNDDSHSEIDKEIIMKKIWNKKRLEHDNENGEVQVTSKQEDIKINQTEVSDEVVIRCGPKAKPSTKRRKSRNSPKESSKERIMRKIWSGKCTFQTKAALKTYESDILNSSKESDSFEEQNRVKKRGRPSNFLNSKKTKIVSDGEKSDEDDLDSLLEEIEREEVEKAIRLEFLQLRRSDKASAEVSREGNKTVGLFAETCQKQGKDIADRRRKRIKKNIKHPRKHLLKRRTFIKKSIVKPQTEGDEERISGPVEDRLKADTETSDVVNESRKPFDLESKIRNRKHKKHRHKHHHHKHKHKKSKHRKYIIGRHKIKHKEDKTDEFENFSILEKMCQEIPNEIEKQTQKRFASELDNLDTKLDEILMSTSSSFDGKTKECEDVFYEGRRIETDRNYEIESENVYDFVDDDSGFLCESKGRHKN